MRSLSFVCASMFAAGVALLAACGTTTRPCTNCPKMEGSWVFGYSMLSTQGSCSGVPAYAPPGTVTLTRAGAAIYSTLGGIDLNGTVYDDDQFTLRGTSYLADGGTTSLYYRGLYLAGGATLPDGGSSPGDAQLTGDFTATVGSGSSECRMPFEFTAVR